MSGNQQSRMNSIRITQNQHTTNHVQKECSAQPRLPLWPWSTKIKMHVSLRDRGFGSRSLGVTNFEAGGWWNGELWTRGCLPHSHYFRFGLGKFFWATQFLKIICFILSIICYWIHTKLINVRVHMLYRVILLLYDLDYKMNIDSCQWKFFKHIASSFHTRVFFTNH